MKIAIVKKGKNRKFNALSDAGLDSCSISSLFGRLIIWMKKIKK